MARIAVIGGGIFGCTAAIYAARAGRDVDLFEKQSGLCQMATGANQFRLHAGYHYPRSPETAAECQAGLQSFYEEYEAAVIGEGRHFYSIASHDSRVSADDYLAFMDGHDLRYSRQTVPFIRNVDLTVRVVEQWYDPIKLKAVVCKKLREAGVNIYLDTPAPDRVRFDYSGCIVAAYADTNKAVNSIPGYEPAHMDKYQFEICEKPLIWVPDDDLRDTGAVIMDGPFCSVDPYARSGLHVLGHVDHAIHSRNVGLKADIPNYLSDYIGRGIVSHPRQSRFDRMRDAASYFFPMISEAHHVGSFFVVRAVFPDRDHDDARPTDVDFVEKDDFIVRIFSGKVVTCVEAAKEAVEMLGNR